MGEILNHVDGGTRMTTLTQIREATLQEQKNEAAEVVFTRVDHKWGKMYTIYGGECHESWMQWGAPNEVLGDNIDDIEKWRKGDKLKGAVDFDHSLLEEMIERSR